MWAKSKIVKRKNSDLQVERRIGSVLFEIEEMVRKKLGGLLH